MDILDPMKIAEYSTTFSSSTLMRTGSSADGSCFFYSVFMAFKEFRKLDESSKKEYIIEKRRQISDRLNPYKWLDSDNAACAIVQISEHMQHLFYGIANYLFHELYGENYVLSRKGSKNIAPGINDNCNKEIIRKHINDGKNLMILFNLIMPSDMDFKILSEWDSEVSKHTDAMDGEKFLFYIKNAWRNIFLRYIDEAVVRVEQNVNMPIEITKRSKILYKLAEESFTIFDIALDAAFQEFKKDIADYDKWVSIFTFLVFKKYMCDNIEILIINGENNDIYKGPVYNPNATKYIILLYFPDLHFESLGYMMNSTTLTRIFDRSHPVVQDFFDRLSL